MQVPQPTKIRIPGTVELSEAETGKVTGPHRVLPWLFGCGTYFFLSVLFFAAFLPAATEGAEALGCGLAQLLPILAACVVTAVSYRALKLKALDRARNDKLAGLIQAAQEAERRVAAIRAQSARIVEELPSHLDSAAGHFASAREELSASAFGPFWDRVEEGALRLGRFKASLDRLTENARRDDQILSEWEHSFPPFPVIPEQIPDPEPVVAELKQVVRLGQTNYQFASIWEQRKTREVLIEGFGTLGEAIVELGTAVATSVSRLKSTMVREIGESRAAQERTRQTIESHGRAQERLLEAHRDILDRLDRKSDR